jgi:hypothetical protein
MKEVLEVKFVLDSPLVPGENRPIAAPESFRWANGFPPYENLPNLAQPFLMLRTLLENVR